MDHVGHSKSLVERWMWMIALVSVYINGDMGHSKSLVVGGRDGCGMIALVIVM